MMIKNWIMFMLIKRMVIVLEVNTDNYDDNEMLIKRMVIVTTENNNNNN